MHTLINGLVTSALCLASVCAMAVVPNPTTANPQPSATAAPKSIQTNLKQPKAPPKPAPKGALHAPPQPLSGLALQWLEQKCPSLIQPYELTGNVSALVGVDSWLERHNPLNGLGKLKDIENLLNGEPPQDTTATVTPAPEPASPGKEDLRSKAKRLNWLPMQAELIYGDREHRQEDEILEPDSEIGERLYPKATAMLAAITQSMKEILAESHETSPYDFRLFILKRDQHNAVARPGGYIYIDAGLLEEDPTLNAKAHFALAHEVAHILRRHETFELQSMVVDSFAAEKDLKLAILSVNKKPANVLNHVEVDKGIYIRHHIDQELQADACGARLLAGRLPNVKRAGRIHPCIYQRPPERATTATDPTNAHRGGRCRYHRHHENAAQQTAAVAAVSYDIVKTPLDQHPNTEERRQRLESAYQEIVRNGHESHLASERIGH